MNTRVKRAIVVFVAALAAAQFVRPNRTNPRTDPTRTLAAQAGAATAAAAVVDRACRDCHSNNTVWPSFTQVAPASWLMAYGVRKGREAVNFSEWGAYSPDVQRMLLSASCDDVSRGKMPGIYAMVRPETRLSREDVETICTAARRADAHALAGGSK